MATLSLSMLYLVGLLSFLSLLGAFQLNVIKRNQAFTKIIEDYRRLSKIFASFWPAIFRISTKNLALLSLRPSLTVGMTKIPKIPGLFHYFFAGISGIFPQNPRPKCLRLLLLV